MKRALDHDDRNFPHREVTGQIIAAALKVHSALGPGLLESAYQICLADEMSRRGLNFEREAQLPVVFEGCRLDCSHRLDFVVEAHVIVEVKCVEALVAIHEAQLLTYLRLAQKDVGLLLNFNEVHLRDGIVRRANTKLIPSSAPSAFSASLR